MRIIKKLKNFKQSRNAYRPLIEVVIFKNKLIGNLNQFKKQYPRLQFAPVLKSNAYGHGLLPVAKILDDEETAFFVIDSLYEAVVLRGEGIKSKLLVIGFTDVANINSSKTSNTAFTITSLEQLKEVTVLHSQTSFHLKIDTGMHRQGISPDELDEAIALVKNNKKILLEGICSHLADADNKNSKQTKEQIALWNKISRRLKDEFSSINYCHLAATAGLASADVIDSNVARLGIGLYGYAVDVAEKLKLKPALRVVSVISSVRELRANDKIGYKGTFTAVKPMTVATIPVGYYEGIDRRLSNRGYVGVDDKYCRIVGRVSMNITTIDVTAVSHAKLNDEVIIISEVPGSPNSVESIAKLLETVPHEILVHIPQHLRRVVR